jgi:hypothetical protein
MKLAGNAAHLLVVRGKSYEGENSSLKGIEMKTWTVVQNTGKRADLESDPKRKEIQRPEHISARDFIHWLPPKSRHEQGSLESLFKQL